MSIGARSQSAKTYLEAHFDEFEDCESWRAPSCAFALSPLWLTRNSLAGDLPTLIKHGLHALRDTLQQDKELTPQNTSLGIVGISSASSSSTEAPHSTDPEAPAPVGAQAAGGFQKFRIVEGEDLQVYLDSMDPKEVVGVEDGAPVPGAAAASGVAGDAPTGGDAAAPGAAAAAPPAAPAAGGDSMETD